MALYEGDTKHQNIVRKDVERYFGNNKQQAGLSVWKQPGKINTTFTEFKLLYLAGGAESYRIFKLVKLFS